MYTRETSTKDQYYSLLHAPSPGVEGAGQLQVPEGGGSCLGQTGHTGQVGSCEEHLRSCWV